MIWIVHEIAVEIGRAARFFCVNQDRVINPQVRQSGKKRHEQVAAIQDGIELFAGPFLIPDAGFKNSPGIAQPPIGGPTITDISLQDVATFRAQLAKVCVAGENNTLILRQSVSPGRATRYLTNSLRQVEVIQRRRMWIKTGKLFELHGGAAKNEASPHITPLLRRLAAPHVRDAIFVFEHGHVRESGRVVFEMQRRGKRVGLAAGDAQKQSGDNRRSDFASHDSAERFAGGSTGSAVALRRFGKIAEATEFFVALFQQLIDRDFQEALQV